MAQNIGPKIGIEGEAEYKRQISEIIQTQKQLKAEMQLVEASFTKDATAKEKSAAKSKVLNEQIAATTSKLKEQEARLKQYEANNEGASTKAEKLRTEITKTKTELANLNTELAKNSSMAAFGRDMQTAGTKISSLGSGMQKVGQTLTNSITKPLTAAGVAAAAMAIEFETAMAKVSTIMDTSQVSMEAMETAILNLSNQTGISASEIAEQTYQAISAGQDTADAVNFVAESTKLAAAGFADTGTTVDALTTILNAYGLESNKTKAISDRLIKTQNLGKTTVAQLGENMGQVIPTAASYSVNLDNIASAYVTLTKQGITTANATTQINALMSELGKSGTGASKALREMTGKTFKELMQDGYSLTDVLKILQAAADENGVALSDMFGNVRAGRAAMALMNDEGVTFTNALQEMANSAGSTDEAFAKMSDTTAHKLKVSLTQVKNAGITAGQALLTTLAPAATKVAEAIEKACKRFDSLTKDEQQAIVKTALFAAAIGPAVTALGGLTKGIGGAVNGVGKLIEHFGTVGTIGSAGILGIAAAGTTLIAVAAKLYDNWRTANDEILRTTKESNQLASKSSEIRSTIEGEAQARRDNRAEMEASETVIRNLVEELTSLDSKTTLTAQDQLRMKEIVGQLNAAMPELNLSIDEATGHLNENSKAVLENVDALMAKMKAEAAQADLQKIATEQYEAEKQLAEVGKQLAEQQNVLAEAEKKLQDARQSGNTFIAQETAAVTDAEKAVNKLKDEQTGLENTLTDLGNEYKEVCGYIDSSNGSLDTNAEALDGTAEAAENAAAAAEDYGDTAANAYQDAYEAALKMADTTCGAFDEIKSKSDVSMDSMKKGLESQIKAFTNYSSNLQKMAAATKNGMNPELKGIVDIIAQMGMDGADYLQVLVDAFENGDADLQVLLDDFGQSKEAKEQFAKTMAEWNTEANTGMTNVEKRIAGAKKTTMTDAKAMAKGITDEFVDNLDQKAIQKAAEGAAGKVESALKTGKTNAESAGKAIGQATTKGIENALKDKTANQAITDAGTGTVNSIKKGVENQTAKDALYSAAKNTGGKVRGLKDAADDAGTDIQNAGTTAAGKLKTGVSNEGTRSEIYSAAYTTGGKASGVADGANAQYNSAHDAGMNVGQGLADGIQDMIADIKAAARLAAQAANKEFESVLQIQSPSKVWMGFGRFMSEGAAIGIEQGIPDIVSSTKNAAMAAIPSNYISELDLGTIGSRSLDPDSIYAAVRSGAAEAQTNIFLNGRELSRGLKSLGVAYST